MKKLVYFFLVFISTQNSKAQIGELISEGVLYFKEKSTFVLPDSISIYNKNNFLNIKLLKQNDALKINYYEKPIDVKSNLILKKIYPFYYTDNSKYNAPLPKMIIRAYYPDYGVFVIDANKTFDNRYEVYINGEWKIIKDNNLKYKKWDEFIKDLLIKLPANKCLYSQKSFKSNKIRTPKDLSYRVVEVKGDWIKIECNKSCENCKNKQNSKGWLKWRNRNKLLVYLYYVC